MSEYTSESVAADFADVFAEQGESWTGDVCGVSDQFTELAALIVDHLIQCSNHNYAPGSETQAIEVVTFGLAMAAEEARRLAAQEMGLMDELMLMGVVQGVSDD